MSWKISVNSHGNFSLDLSEISLQQRVDMKSREIKYKFNYRRDVSKRERNLGKLSNHAEFDFRRNLAEEINVR